MNRFFTNQDDDTIVNLAGQSGTAAFPTFLSGSLPMAALASPNGFTPGMMAGAPGSPQWNANIAASSVNNVSIFNNGWLGGDRFTGQGGDVGNFGHVDNSTTFNQAAAAAASDPSVKEPFYASLHADVQQASNGSKAGLTAAFQGVQNQAAWLEQNINFGNTSAENINIGEAQIVSNTTVQSATCIAGVSTVALLAATTPESAPLTVMLPTFTLGVSTLVMVTNDCYAAVNNWGSDIGDALQAAIYGVSGAAYALSHDFMMGPGGSESVGLSGKAGGFTMTPGFHPSMAYISSIASHLTPAAQQLYLGHS